MWLCKGVQVREELSTLKIYFHFFPVSQRVSELIFKASVHIGKTLKEVKTSGFQMWHFFLSCCNQEKEKYCILFF